MEGSKWCQSEIMSVKGAIFWGGVGKNTSPKRERGVPKKCFGVDLFRGAFGIEGGGNRNRLNGKDTA